MHPDPLHATVTAAGDATICERGEDGGACYELSLTVDVGRSHGVFVGMKLYPVTIDGFLGLEIAEVGPSTSRGRYSDCFERGETVVLPQVGWNFSTLSPSSESFDGFRFADHPALEGLGPIADLNANSDGAASAPAEKR